MDKNEINKIIFDFMGYEITKIEFYGHERECYIDEDNDIILTGFTKSLDSLVPVWEKLKSEKVLFNLYYNVYEDWKCEVWCEKSFNRGFDFVEESKNAQLAAATATAKAIKELAK